MVTKSECSNLQKHVKLTVSGGCHGNLQFQMQLFKFLSPLFVYFLVCLCFYLQVDGKKIDLPELEGIIFLNIRR